MSISTIDSACPHCGATGLYCGFAEPAGVAVVCLACEGTGCLKLKYTPFTGRQPKSGARTVRRSAGTFLVSGVGPTGDSVTYAEFERGILPGAGSNVKPLAPRGAKASTPVLAKKRASR
jgi:hypothetical protein